MSVVAHTIGEGKAAVGLVAKLRWSVLSTASAPLKPKDASKSIRTQASLIGATRFITHDFDGTTFLGQYTEPVRTVEQPKPPKQLHSLALVFLAALARSGMDIGVANAILLVEPQGLPEKRALVIIEGGQIVRDVIENASQAIEAAKLARDGLPDHVIYAQYPELSATETITWEFLEQDFSKETLLRPVPRSPATLYGVALVLIAAVGWYGYQTMVVEPEKARQRRIAAQKADKTPQYVSLLRSSLGAYGWASADLQKQLAALSDAPFYFSGWALERRDCVAATGVCVGQWKRTGGQLSGLAALLPKATYDVAGSTLDVAKMSEPFQPVPNKSEPEALVPLEQAARDLRQALQKLANAEIVATTGGTEKWPVMDFNGVRPNVVASRASVEIIAPLPLAVAALRELPPNVVMDGYSLIVSSGDVGTLFKVSMKGYVYGK